MATRQATSVVATPESQKSVKDMRAMIRGFFPEGHRKLYFIAFGVSMMLRTLRVGLAGFVEKRQFDSDFVGGAQFTPGFFTALYTLVGLVGFVQYMSAVYHVKYFTKVTFHVGYSVAVVTILIDWVSLAWASKTIDVGPPSGEKLNSGLLALLAFSIIQAGFEPLVLWVHYRTKPVEDLAFDHQLTGKPLIALSALDIIHLVLLILRCALAAQLLNRLMNHEPDALAHTNTSGLILLVFTLVAGLGLGANAGGFIYFSKQSRPTYYLQATWLLWAFSLDVMCMGFAARMFYDGVTGGLDKYAQGVGGFTFIQVIVTVVHMACHSMWEPDAPNPRPGFKDAKIDARVLKAFVFFTAADVILRIVRCSMAAALFNRYFDDPTSVTGFGTNVTPEVMMFTLFSASGFATAWSGKFYSFFFSQAAFFVHLTFLSFTWWLDFASAGFGIGQYIATPNSGVDILSQVLGGLNVIACCVLAILFLVVLWNKPKVDEMSEAQRHASIQNDVDPRIHNPAGPKMNAAAPADAAHHV